MAIRHIQNRHNNLGFLSCCLKTADMSDISRCPFYHVPDRGGFIALKACIRPARSLKVCQFSSEIAVRSVESNVLVRYTAPGGAVGPFEHCISPGALYEKKQRLRLRLMWTRHQVSGDLATETASPVCDPVKTFVCYVNYLPPP